MNPTIDTIRALFTYATALIVVIGGGAAIYVSRGDPAAADTVAIMAGFVGAALSFLFNQEVATRTARQSAAVQAATTTNGTTPHE